jgi:ABC-type amino acid transport substrate-binding protein
MGGFRIVEQSVTVIRMTSTSRTSRRLVNRPLARFLAFVTLTALGALAMSGCGAEGHGESSKTLVVGSDLTYPPYASLDGDKPVGFDPEIITAIGKALGRKVSIKDTRFEQLIPSLGAGQIDVIASALYITAERAKQVDYIPYFSTGNSIVVKKGAAPIEDASGLCGKKVAVIKGGDIVQRLRVTASAQCKSASLPTVDVREFTTDPEGTQALLSGQVDAQVTDAGVASTLGDSTGGKIVISSKELLYPVPVGLAVKKGNTKLLHALQKGLARIKADGSYDRLLTKYNLRPVSQKQVDDIIGSS